MAGGGAGIATAQAFAGLRGGSGPYRKLRPQCPSVLTAAGIKVITELLEDKSCFRA
jgi:hypothetical protein